MTRPAALLKGKDDRMNWELKSISIWAFVKITFFVSLILGFIFGIFYGMVAGLMLSVMSEFAFMSQDDMSGLSAGSLMIIMPFFMSAAWAVMNTILGAIGVVIYNLLARLLGGLEFSFSPVESTSPPAPAVPTTAYTAASSTPPPPPPVMPGIPPVAPPQPPSRPPQRDSSEPE